MTIFDHSGHWAYNDAVGITIRHMHDPTDCTYPWVASMCRHPKLIIYYTDWNDVDEDAMTLTRQGGDWTHISRAGITDRNLTSPSTDSGSHVASVQKKINRTYSPFGDACSFTERQIDFMLTV